jgi:hypothetical protein
MLPPRGLREAWYETIQKAAGKPTMALKLQARLAEYSALREEIKWANDLQARVLQLHIATATVIIGASIAQFTQAYWQWLIFVVPFESCVFWLRYMNLSLNTRRIGVYIRDTTEPAVNGLLEAETDRPVMGW